MTNLVCSLQFGGNIYKVIYWWVLEFCNQLKTWHVTCYLVQFSRSVLSDSVTPWTAACQASLSIIKSQSLLKLKSTELVRPFNHLILCCPLFLLPSIFPSIRVFTSESVLRIRWPSIGVSASTSVLAMDIQSFRMDWLDLLAVHGMLKSLLQHHSSKASILQHSAFFIVQVSHPYVTTGKIIVLTRWTFAGKIILCFLICYPGWS